MPLYCGHAGETTNGEKPGGGATKSALRHHRSVDPRLEKAGELGMNAWAGWNQPLSRYAQHQKLSRLYGPGIRPARLFQNGQSKGTPMPIIMHQLDQKSANSEASGFIKGVGHSL
jgi:hypothetical protein